MNRLAHLAQARGKTWGGRLAAVAQDEGRARIAKAVAWVADVVEPTHPRPEGSAIGYAVETARPDARGDDGFGSARSSL